MFSRITYPTCRFQKEEIMPANGGFFYECPGCKTLLKPQAGDYCVFCSYGTAKCPPMRTDRYQC
ncbi:MAG: GDCCVxC domain-containing (seleno)protein [Verrucomicrobiota bacterium]